MKRQWQTLDERIIVKDQWIDLRAETCVTPSGAVLDPFYSLRNPDFVHIVALTGNNEVVLVREYRHPIGQTVLNLPGGWIEPSEAPLAAAQRELAEETGYATANWRFIARIGADVGRQNNWVHVFLAQDVEPRATRKLDVGEEGMTVEILPVDTLYAGLTQGLLPHAAHLAAFLLAMAEAGRLRMR